MIFHMQLKTVSLSCKKTVSTWTNQFARQSDFDDIKVEFEITSNRPDCFSIIGLAREAAATFDKPLTLHTPVCKSRKWFLQKGVLDVKIEEPSLCSVYSARIVENVGMKPSPLAGCVKDCAMGVRPINNIVDITNYVMLEYGQPYAI